MGPLEKLVERVADTGRPVLIADADEIEGALDLIEQGASRHPATVLPDGSEMYALEREVVGRVVDQGTATTLHILNVLSEIER